MNLTYKKLGLYIKQINNKNCGFGSEFLRGINIKKEFMPSVADTTNLDLSKYKLVKKGQFAYNPMHVGRDKALPISLLQNEDKIIVSPAYTIFEVIDKYELHPEYLFMWFKRDEFDRRAWFTTDNSIRGGFSWNSLCEMEIPIPEPEQQKKIVDEYNSVIARIRLNKLINKKLEEMAMLMRTMNFDSKEVKQECIVD